MQVQGVVQWLAMHVVPASSFTDPGTSKYRHGLTASAWQPCHAPHLVCFVLCQGGVCLEEFLQLDRAADGIILSPAVHYMEGKLVGHGLVDQIM